MIVNGKLILTLRNSSGRPAAKTTLPSSSMIARPTSAHTTFARMSNPPASFCTTFMPSPDPFSFDIPISRDPERTQTASAISMVRTRSFATNFKTVLYNAARGSSVSSKRGAEGALERVGAAYGVNGVCAGAVSGVEEDAKEELGRGV